MSDAKERRDSDNGQSECAQSEGGGGSDKRERSKSNIFAAVFAGFIADREMLVEAEELLERSRSEDKRGIR